MYSNIVLRLMAPRKRLQVQQNLKDRHCSFLTDLFQHLAIRQYQIQLRLALQCGGLYKRFSSTVSLVTDTSKFDRGLTHQLMHVDLHWLDVPERVKFKLVSTVHNCLHHKAPRYLMDCCIPVSDVAGRRHLRSARRRRVITWLYRDTASARLGVGHLLLLARLPGTH